MTDVQLYLAIGVPMAFSAILFTVFTQMINKRMDDRFASMICATCGAPNCIASKKCSTPD